MPIDFRALFETEPDDEELRRQEERQRTAGAERETMRRHQARYEELAGRMKTLLDNVREHHEINAHDAQQLRESILHYHETVGSTLFDVLQLVRFGANYYAYHALNVPLLSLTIGKGMELSGGELARLVDAGMLMDTGMLLMPAKVLEGNKRLGSFDLAMIRKHPGFTAALLKKSGLSGDAALMTVIASHHERFNGTGYPGLVQGYNIPLEARIIAVADSFDAATARRGYRRDKSPFAILQELMDNRDGALDPAIVNAAAVGLARMLVGRFVVLSDHSVGRVVEISPNNIAYPVVVVVGQRVRTSPSLYPVALSSQMRLY